MMILTDEGSPQGFYINVIIGKDFVLVSFLDTVIEYLTWNMWRPGEITVHSPLAPQIWEE